MGIIIKHLSHRIVVRLNALEKHTKQCLVHCQLLLFIIMGAGCQLEEEILKVGFKERKPSMYLHNNLLHKKQFVSTVLHKQPYHGSKIWVPQKYQRLFYEVSMDVTLKVPVNPGVLSKSA